MEKKELSELTIEFMAAYRACQNIHTELLCEILYMNEPNKDELKRNRLAELYLKFRSENEVILNQLKNEMRG